MSHSTSIRIALSILAGVVTYHQASADGFRNPPASARGIGRISGYTPHIDDPSAIAINPANLADLEEASVLTSVSFGYATVEFDPLLGESEKSKDPVALLPSLYAAWPVEENDLVAGIGLNVPYGRFTKFDDDATFRFSAPTFAQLYVIDLKPTVAARLSDRVTVGLGADIYYSDLRFRQFIPWAVVTGVPSAPEGEASFEGDGTGFGGSAGITLQLSQKQRMALTYRTAFDIDYAGDFTVENLPPPLAAAGLSSSSDFDSTIKYPSQVALGYGVQLTDSVRFGVEVEWQDTSRFRTLPVDIKNNNALLPTRELPQQWDDHWTYGGGFDWQVSESWTFRGGYIYLEAPTPDSTLLPVQAEDDQHAVSIGLGYENNGSAIDVSYMIGLFDGDRKVRDNPDPLLNGDYELESHFVSVAYRKDL